jgi:hypothetical protein
VKFRASAAALSAGALLFTLSGCAGSNGPTKGGTADARHVAAVRDAAETTSKAGTSRMRTAMTVYSGSNQYTFTSQGAFDYAKGRGMLTLDVPPGAGNPGSVEQIVTPTVVYLRNSGQPGQANWAQIDIARLAESGSGGGSVGGTNPATSFQMLRGVSGHVTVLGKKSLNGASVTHYRGTLDLRKAVDASPASDRQAMEAALRMFGDPLVPFDAYLDDAGRLRKLEEVFQIRSKKKPEENVKVLSSMELYDFGVPVAVQVPDARDVVIPSASLATVSTGSGPAAREIASTP